MFTQGFNKTACVVKEAWNPMTGVGQISRGVKSVGTAVSTGVGNVLAGGKASRMEGALGRKIGTDSETGLATGLAKQRMKKNFDSGNLKPLGDVQKKTRLDVAKRKSRMDNYKEDKALKDKPSFARKHPFLTAGGLYLGAKAAFGGKDDKQPQQPPQVQQGQY